jgi:hypothetical protein
LKDCKTMPELSAHDWFRPRLLALLTEARRAGYGPDVAEAVITDLVNGPLAEDVPLAPADENWAQDIGEPKAQATEMPRSSSPLPEPFGSEPIIDVLPNAGRRNSV